jgi:S-DNA-T family DNA segregation ATPase FtsK/SpoIIIE
MTLALLGGLLPQGENNMVDPLYQEAVDQAKKKGYVSVSYLQRTMRVGYTRAARLIDLMEENGFCEKENDVFGHRRLISATDWQEQG